MTKPATAGGTVLAHVRTHPKVLFQPVVIQLVLIAAHIAVSMFWPETFGIKEVDEWGQLVVHGALLLAELVYAIAPVVRWWNATFTVTDQRLEQKWGVLYKHAREISLDRIASVEVERGILDRIFGCGTIVAYDATLVGMGQSKAQGIRFNDVPRVKHVKELIDSARYARS
jgi:Predicted membrane protein